MYTDVVFHLVTKMSPPTVTHRRSLNRAGGTRRPVFLVRLVVWTPLKNITQLGWLFHIILNIWEHKKMFQTTTQWFISTKSSELSAVLTSHPAGQRPPIRLAPAHLGNLATAGCIKHEPWIWCPVSCEYARMKRQINLKWWLIIIFHILSLDITCLSWPHFADTFPNYEHGSWVTHGLKIQRTQRMDRQTIFLHEDHHVVNWFDFDMFEPCQRTSNCWLHHITIPLN